MPSIEDVLKELLNSNELLNIKFDGLGEVLDRYMLTNLEPNIFPEIYYSSLYSKEMICSFLFGWGRYLKANFVSLGKKSLFYF